VNDYDELNDSTVLCAVRDSLAGISLPAAPPLAAVVARGRTRRRRRAGLAATGAAAVAAVAIGVSGIITSPAPAHGGSTADLTAFSVVSSPDGTTTLTLKLPDGLRNPAAVRQALARHGIPALVTTGKVCTTSPRPQAPGAISLQPPLPPGGLSHARGAAGTPGRESVVFTPSAMPAGTEVSIGYLQNPPEIGISVHLIEVAAPLTCTSTLPGRPGPVEAP
jgi:hypothetical protein